MLPNVFDTLFKHDICFAVCASVVRFTIKGLDFHSSNFFIVVQKFELPHLKRFYFKKSPRHSDIYEYDLSEQEVEYFKTVAHLFTREFYGEEGRVFELTEKPFKRIYLTSTNLKTARL